jgi:curved DNA-binding protein CbpA
VADEAYRKWVQALHPDRGGDAKRFQVVNQAYQVVKGIIRQTQMESFDALQRQANRDLGGDRSEANQTLAPLGHGEAFNSERFNQVFQDHRIWSPQDEGYGTQMVASEYTSAADRQWDAERLNRQRQLDVQNVFAGAPNAQLLDLGDGKQFHQDFNQAFLQQTVGQQQHQFQQQQQHRGNTSMVVRREPREADLLFKSSTSQCQSLSAEHVDDFSSPFLGGGGGAYTDYMRAFGSDSLITPHVLNASSGSRAKTVEELTKERDQLSFIPDPALLEERARQEAREKEEDEQRWRNFLRYQEQVQANHASITNVLSDKSSVPTGPPQPGRK